MKQKLTTLALAFGLGALFATTVGAQAPAVATAEEVAKALGFTDAEVGQIKAGQIIQKDLKSGSDKELAGVVAVLFKQPVSELVEVAMQGKALETTAGMQAFRVWKPDASADEAFADVGLSASETGEAGIFAKAAAGSKLNLSAAEIEQFRKSKPDVNAINTELRAMLKARYETYRKSGLNGIAPYARGGSKTASPAEELTLAIKETMTVARRQDFFNALLSYPAGQLPDTEHRYYWFKMTVENRPTFVLAHRAERHAANAALLTEEQYYVGHSYNSNFIAGGALEVQGGTIVFYVNRTFTDQVAGFGSGMKQSIGRGQMLDTVTAKLQSVRGQLSK